jgi:hypothetical protein
LIIGKSSGNPFKASPKTVWQILAKFEWNGGMLSNLLKIFIDQFFSSHLGFAEHFWTNLKRYSFMNGPISMK